MKVLRLYDLINDKETIIILLHIGTGNRDYFKDRIGRGCKTRRCGLPDGCGIPDTVICGVFWIVRRLWR